MSNFTDSMTKEKFYETARNNGWVLPGDDKLLETLYLLNKEYSELGRSRRMNSLRVENSSRS